MAEVTVPQEADEERHRAARADGETRGSTSEAKEAGGKHAEKEARDRERRRKELEREREAQAAVRSQKAPVEISFKDAKDVAKVVTAIQDERQVVVSPKEFGNLKKLLIKAGYELKQVEKMTDAQIVVTAQQVLRNAKIVEPEESDWQYSEGSPNRKLEEELAGEQIGKVQSLEEELLTAKKVEEYLTVEDEEFAKAAERGGPGTMEAGGLPDESAVTPEVARYIREVQRTETIRSERTRLNALGDIESSLRRAVLSGELSEDAEGVAEIREVVRQRLEAFAEGVVSVMVDPETSRIIESLVGATGEERERLTRDLDRKIARVQALVDAVELSNFREAYLITKAAEQAERIYKNELARPGMDDIRDKLVKLTQRGTGLLVLLERKFRRKYNELNSQERTALVGDIDRDAITYFKQIASGLGVTPEEAKARLSVMTGEDPTGLREWRVMRSIEGVENAVRVDQLLEVPVIWEEIPEKIINIYNFVESTDLSVEEMSATIQRAIAMVGRIPPDIPEGRQVKEGLVKELEAFRAFHSFRITMQRSAMNPEEMGQVFKGYFKDDTWKDFVERFAKDSRGRGFYDASGKEVNLFDTAEKLYFARLHGERLRMNVIEELSKHGLNLNSNDFDEQWIILRLALHDKDKGEKADEEFKNLIKRVNAAKAKGLKEWNTLGEISDEELAAAPEIIGENDRDFFSGVFREKIGQLTPKQREKLDAWGLNVGRDVDPTKDVIRVWYEENTLLGALEHLDFRRKEVFDVFFKEKLKDLQVKETDGTYRKADLEDLRQSGFLESVDYNAYYFVWMMGWSDYDVIRIYDREAAGKDSMIKATAYNESSYMWYGRHLDHWWEFLVDEVRGRPVKETEVNEIIRKAFPGKRHDIFARNRTMIRFFKNFVTEKQKKALDIDGKVKDLMARFDFDHPDPEYKEWFKSWAEGIVIAELIDDGEISFDQQNFSEKPIEKAQYFMADLFSDRAAAAKYLSRDNFQNYLINPTEDKFAEINDQMTNKFYSGRVIRIWPWMTLALRAHWEVANRHSLRLFNRPDLQSAAMENVVNALVNNGVIEKEQGNDFKRKYLFLVPFVGNRLSREARARFAILGTIPFRRLRQLGEVSRRLLWESKYSPIPIIWAMIVEFFKTLTGQLTQAR